MAGKIGIAVVGCGYWGMNYVRVFSELPDTRVVCVCDERPERLEEVSKRFPGIFLTPQLDSALRHDGVDAVDRVHERDDPLQSHPCAR